jgi:protein-tyrosine phosphatase
VSEAGRDPRPDAVRGTSTRPTVLLVCQANVCRSRAAEVLLRHRLAVAGLALDVRSSGTAAPAHAQRCTVMDRLLTARGHVLPDDGGPRQLDAATLDSASLVLVTERRHRAQAARLDPASRSRTFTVLEAEALATGVSGHASAGTASRGTGRGASAGVLADDALRTVVADLHAARGSVPLPEESAPGRVRPPWRRAAPTSGIDLVDVHERSSRVHARSLQRLDRALDPVVFLLAARLSP